MNFDATLSIITAAGYVAIIGAILASDWTPSPFFTGFMAFMLAIKYFQQFLREKD